MRVLNGLAGLVCGVLSGYGIGGGSLLLLWMTQVAGLGQAAAQGINLVYFLPTSASAVISHLKNGLVAKKAVLWAAIPGTVTAAAAAFFAVGVEPSLLRRLFGIFCVLTGVKMLAGSMKKT